MERIENDRQKGFNLLDNLDFNFANDLCLSQNELQEFKKTREENKPRKSLFQMS
jgi:hypothetical protein